MKPYLQLDRMIEAVFAVSGRLFGLEFRALDVPLYHADARAWEVTRKGRHLAVFIGDYFARGSKRSGAWCSAMRSQKKAGRRDYGPSSSMSAISQNLQTGSPRCCPTTTRAHCFMNFGHALHQMLSDVTYESISGTSVARDFVELPSQLFEHWLEVPEVLAEFATPCRNRRGDANGVARSPIGCANL